MLNWVSILVVTTPAASRDLTTLAVVKDELDIKDRTVDDRLKRWIADASGVIERYTRRYFIQESVTETFYQGGWQGSSMALEFGPVTNVRSWFERSSPATLCLRRYPVSTVASVTADGTILTAGTDYMLDAEAGLLYRMSSDGHPVSWGETVIAVSYTAGYPSIAELPGEVREACILMVSHRNSSRGRDPQLRQVNIPGVQEETYWVGATGDNGALSPEVQGRLDLVRDYRL